MLLACCEGGIICSLLLIFLLEGLCSFCDIVLEKVLLSPLYPFHSLTILVGFHDCKTAMAAKIWQSLFSWKNLFSCEANSI